MAAFLLGFLIAIALGVSLLQHETGNAAAPLPFHPIAAEFVPDGTRIHDCSDARCFEQALGNVAFEEGPEAAFEAAGRVYRDGADPACHRAAHAIGAAALARFGGDVARTLAEGSSECWSGYYHGVLERSLVDVDLYEPAALARVARRLCAGVAASATPWIAYQCLHGLGHGLMLSTGLDLPRSLAVCKRLASSWDRDACKGGVFMENISPSYGVRSRWIRDDDPVYPCNEVAREDKRRCYQIVTSRILAVVGGDWHRVAAVCASVEQDFVGICFHSFGRDVSSRSGRDANAVVETCSITRSLGGEADCITAAAMDMTANFASGAAAARLCEIVSSPLRGRCYRGIGAVMGTFAHTSAERVADCTALASTAVFAAECVHGAGEALPRRLRD